MQAHPIRSTTGGSTTGGSTTGGSTTGKAARGFTLVELLVVIAIIGVLVALLVPAVGVARRIAAKNQCANNLRGLGQAMIGHESDKQYFPGRTNVILNAKGVPIQVSWFAKLLPYMERNAVWDLIVQDAINPTDNPDDPARYVTEVPNATCPSDPVTTPIAARLGYVLNSGILDQTFGPNPNRDWVRDLRANGIGQYLPYNVTTNRVDSAFISKNDGTTATLMLSENVNAVTWVPYYNANGIQAVVDEALQCIVWTPQEVVLEPNAELAPDRQYGINKGHERFLDDQLLQQSGSLGVRLASLARPSSFHSGGVNAAFADGHVEFVADDIHPWVYARRLSISGPQARYPSIGNFQQPVPAQVSPSDSQGNQVPITF